MGNYEQLKQSVSDVIKTNGNQEITGSILQNVLLTIISTVGANATFAGIATPATNPGTPDGPVFYLASESGTYTNFNAIELQDGLSVLLWNGSWNSQQIFSIDDEPTAGSKNLVESNGVYEDVCELDLISRLLQNANNKCKIITQIAFTEYNVNNGYLGTGERDVYFRASAPIFVDDIVKNFYSSTPYSGLVLCYSEHPKAGNNQNIYLGFVEVANNFPTGTKYIVLGFGRNEEITGDITVTLKSKETYKIQTKIENLEFGYIANLNQITRKTPVVYKSYNAGNGELSFDGAGIYMATSPIYVNEARKLFSENSHINGVLYYKELPTNADNFIIYSNFSALIPANAKYAVIGMKPNEATLGEQIEVYADTNLSADSEKKEFDKLIFENESTKEVVIEYNEYNVNYGNVVKYDGSGQYKATSPIYVKDADNILCNSDKFNVILFYSDYPIGTSTFINYSGQSGLTNIPSNAKYAVIGLTNNSGLNLGDRFICYANINLRNKKNRGITKELWTLWDSLGQNTWQNYISNENILFDKELNLLPSKPLSYGGTTSSPVIDNGTQARAINLVSYKGIYPIDIVLIENINDIALTSNVGTISDTPFMRKQKILLDGESASYEDARAYISENLSDILSSIDSSKRLKGSIISRKYNSNSLIAGSTIMFNSGVSNEGDISLTWNGVAYPVHVTVGMTPEDIASEFEKYSFGPGITDYNNGDGSLTIVNYTESSMRITAFDGGSTGVTATISDATVKGEYSVFFTGYLASEWTTIAKWTDNLSLYSIYKGLVEYLIANLPEAQLYWCMPYAESVDFSSNSHKNPDGTWTLDGYTYPFANLYNIQKNICDYYGIPAIEMYKKAEMSLLNIETYFYSGNVHPKPLGYKRYAEFIDNYINANCFY